MKKIDIASMAFQNFRKRKLRSFLTVLGVVIGVASIVVMVSLGIAVNVSFSKEMEQMGDLTLVQVYPNYGVSGGEKDPNKGKLTDDLVTQFEQLDHVVAVSPQLSLSGHFIAGKYHANVTIIGIRKELFETLGFTVERGSLLPEDSTMTGKSFYCLFGGSVPSNFYNPRDNSYGGGIIIGMAADGVYAESNESTEPTAPVDPLDENTRIRFTFDSSYGMPNAGSSSGTMPTLYTAKVTGVLPSDYSEKSWNVYVDMETALKLKKESDKYYGNKPATSVTYDQIYVKADSLKNTMAISEQIQQMGYQTYNSAEWIQSYQKQSQSLQLILGGIGAVSLLVAAIGITNTMIMSIYERTREIGIMKVLGCVLGDIKTLFLYEAAIIGLTGGLAGIAFSYLVSALLNTVSSDGGILGGMSSGSKLSVIPPWLALSAVLFAVLVGLVSGYLPARRAMKLSSLEAMRS